MLASEQVRFLSLSSFHALAKETPTAMSSTPACTNCNETLAPYGRKGYDGHATATCELQTSEDCPVDICSACAALYEVDGGYDDDGRGTRSRARCFYCVDELPPRTPPKAAARRHA